MDATDKRKYLKILALTVLAIVIFFPDVVFDMATSALHFLFERMLELIHLLFEGVESMLDHLVEGIFETDVHSTQTIVFYILLAIGAFLLFRAGRFLLRLYRRCHQAWVGYWAEHHHDGIEYWRGLSLFGKLKLILIPALLVYLYVMFFI